MPLYPIHYYDDKDYYSIDIPIFHSHYPDINIQYAEINFRMFNDYRGAEFQIMDCTSEYLIFTLNTIWGHCFGGRAIEYAEAKEKEERKEWLIWYNKIWDAINDKKNKIQIKELFNDMLQEESSYQLMNIYQTFIEYHLNEED